MDINQLQKRLSELRSDAAASPIYSLIANVGQIGQMEGRLEGSDCRSPSDRRTEDGTSEGSDEELESSEGIAKLRERVTSSLLVAAFDYASQHDVNVEKAMDDTIEELEKRKETESEIEEAMEKGSAKDLADALGSDANEVPTGDEGSAGDKSFY